MLDSSYAAFLSAKQPRAEAVGLPHVRAEALPDFLFDFAKECTAFCLRQGRAGLFLDTGMTKTRQQAEFLAQAYEATNGYALMLAPLACAQQHEVELQALGYDARTIRSANDIKRGINICNYDRLNLIDPQRFGAVALDESGILKNFTGTTSKALRAAFANHRFRLSATATPAPNDHMELGQQAEFLGIMASNEMLMRWFTADQTQMGRYRLKGHGTHDFWDWMASWSRMAQSPEDLGFDGSRFVLPDLIARRHKAVGEVKWKDDTLFGAALSATNMHDVKRQTSEARAEKCAEVVTAEGAEPWVIWCDTDYEADALKARLPHAVEVRGSMSIEAKEEALQAFAKGQAKDIITKPSICGYGLNWQHSARSAFAGRTFSYEAFYQAIRRQWRFGQKRPVEYHLIVAEGEDQIGRVISRKAEDHETMKRAMAAAMRRALGREAMLRKPYDPRHDGGLPPWLFAA